MRTFIIVFLFCLNSYAFVGDTALLMELVSTTVQELNELEQLVTSAEKYTKKLREYNELMQDEYFRAERIKYLAEELVAKREIENLADFNMALRDLKYTIEDLKFLINEYREIQKEEKRTQKIIEVKKKLLERKELRAKVQVKNSIEAETNSRANQLTAQNTALIYETEIESQEIQLEILKNVAKTNKILARMEEEKKKEELERRRFYRQESRSKK